MIDVTKIVLNFHEFLINLSNSLSLVNRYKDSDEWEELTESSYRSMVIQHINEIHDLNIESEYEVWLERKTKDSLLVEVKSGSKVLVGHRVSENSYHYDYEPSLDSEVSLSFIEFNHIELDPEDDFIKRLNYVMGVDSEGVYHCAELQDCKFYVIENK
jgi:hypothetical protein